jgi:uncharacterized membrane protein YedE/YeeE
MRTRVAGAAIGVVFGVTLSWSGMSSPDVIREALLFKQAYLFEFFAAAVLTGAVGLRLLRRTRRRAVLTDEPIGWAPERPGRRHVTGSLLFGVGWGVADACPGPIATQLGQGIPWALVLMTGVAAGVYAYLRRDAPETEPPSDAPAPGPAHAAPAVREPIPA